jgi:hypothetical protein
MFGLNNVIITGSVKMWTVNPPAPPPSSGGSIAFNGTTGNIISAASSDWALGTNDFTIEWYQNQTSGGGANTRPFSVGGYPIATAAVSIEGESMFYFWADGTGFKLSAAISGFLDTWTHFAVVRSSGVLTAYQNGNPIASASYSGKVGDSASPLSIGAEYQTSAASGTFFAGKITNFRWTAGEAIYTSSFTPPSAALTTDSYTKTLLLATDSGTVLTDTTGNHTFTNASGSTIAWDSGTPF